MIGHVFASSGATCLAVAPSEARDDEYVVLARYEDQYAVAGVLIDHMPAPDHWLQGLYCPDLDEALENFSSLAGLPDDRLPVIRRQVQRAEERLVASTGATS